MRLRTLIATGAAGAARRAAGLSFSQMSRPMQVAPSTVLRWEAGLRFPRPAHALRYLALLDRLMNR
jgi:DNA-binding transcriptional regulator YiaG